jgi:hypothetical protein
MLEIFSIDLPKCPWLLSKKNDHAAPAGAGDRIIFAEFDLFAGQGEKKQSANILSWRTAPII